MTEPWGNTFGGLQDFSQSPYALPTTSDLSYRIYTGNATGAVIIASTTSEDSDYVFTRNAFGILVTEEEMPVRQVRFNGTVISDATFASGPVGAVVVANASGVYLVNTSFEAPFSSTTVLLQSTPSVSNVAIVRSNPALILVGVDNTVYSVADMMVQGVALLDSAVQCIEFDPSGQMYYASSQSKLFALSTWQLLVSWTYTFPSALQFCPLATNSSINVMGVGSYVALASNTGLVENTAAIDLACRNKVMALSGYCSVLCQSATTGNLVAFNIYAQGNAFEFSLSAYPGATLVDVIVDVDGKVAWLVSVSSPSPSIVVYVTDAHLSLVWKTSLPGLTGRMAITSDNHLIVRTDSNGNPASYIYAFGA